MTMILNNKRILLGVSGSIASYKSLDLTSKLVQSGAIVDVIMTEAACKFITPLSFQSISRRPVFTNLWDSNHSDIGHIEMANSTDLVVIAPATANVIAKLAHGLADDLLTTTMLATKAKVIVAPAMDGNMYYHPSVQENINKLVKMGIIIVGPNEGRLASGLVSKGRLAEPYEILGHIRAALGKEGDLKGKKIVVTAGGTQEPIDPVRIISNHSSGKMGYALAEVARDRGAEVILVTAATALPIPVSMEIVPVKTAADMQIAVEQSLKNAHALIMAAAIGDFRPNIESNQKIKSDKEHLNLSLTKNPDILGTLKGSFIKVGFAAETQSLETNARKKMLEKDLDFIVANNVIEIDSGFGSDTNRVVILDKKGDISALPTLPKEEVAERILDRIVEIIQ
ncbi:MAG: bifunctional phosphopantothenoylcysteine decarboxylase/phosphopantothenate--cysteine ligase CoaBC [Dehalococcoidia bacterium]|nr:bifunctional phosphopantothenoylcysteine decarboxylase/phosphopantothenate--cysteine ligase CoaBC [Dehalococcoidia bacterium]